MAKLSKRIIDGLDVRPTDYLAWDDELRGFGVRVWPSGRKTYVAQYRSSGRTRRFKIGDHGHLTIDEARKEAKGVLGEVARGRDPADDRATRRKTLTVEDLCRDYMAAAEKGLILGRKAMPKKASTLEIDRGRIKRHIVPLLGRRLVTDVTHADVAKFVRDVSAGKTAVTASSATPHARAVVTGGPGTAARTVGFLGGIFTFAVSEGIIGFNPARGVKRHGGNPRTRRLTAEDYQSLGQAIREAEAERDTWQGIAAAKLLALTGCRLGEILGLRWDEVDETAQCLRLGDTKTGASVRPLGKPALIVLASLKRSGSDFVLPGVRREGHYRGTGGGIGRLTKRAGLTGVTAHTLRHSFASTAGDLGYAESTIAALIGHAASTVTGRYVHILDTVLLTAADKVAATIATSMGNPTMSD